MVVVMTAELMMMSNPQPEPAPSVTEDVHSDAIPFDGIVKWFDATRGFGFVIDESFDGDILIHFSVLRDHNRRSLPEGARITGVAAQQQRGYQAQRIDTIDLSTALPSPRCPPVTTTVDPLMLTMTCPL